MLHNDIMNGMSEMIKSVEAYLKHCPSIRQDELEQSG